MPKMSPRVGGRDLSRPWRASADPARRRRGADRRGFRSAGRSRVPTAGAAAWLGLPSWRWLRPIPFLGACFLEGHAEVLSYGQHGCAGRGPAAPPPVDQGPDRHRIRAPQKARHLDRFPATARAKRRLQHPRGRADYRMQARTAEPVVGQLKTCQKLTIMSRHGFTAGESEWLMVCAAYNLRKLHRHRLRG